MRISNKEWVCRNCGFISLHSLREKAKNFAGLNQE